MATNHMLALLIIERDKLTGAIEALQGPTTTQKTQPQVSVGPTAPVKRKLSAAGRRAIVAATKRRWAAVKAAKAAAAPASVAVAHKAAPAKVPAAAKRKKSSAKDAAFRKKMSERMKVAWAARKKKEKAS